eukprot:TRINITY_DN4307_c0_g1_i1.p1 TRINITY_DN4307_c0_g1~~TRINITY_DN4307_c0_g1_i1.p1  ORF type:complete len:304 (+),score=33.12 TRINITY_DN4307_c0_g1_i1:129-914(+)
MLQNSEPDRYYEQYYMPVISAPYSIRRTESGDFPSDYVLPRPASASSSSHIASAATPAPAPDPTPRNSTPAARPTAPAPAPRPTPQPRPTRPVTMEELWGSFFVQVRNLLVALVRSGRVPRDDVESMEAYLFLGLPGLTLAHLMARSASAREGFSLASGVHVTADTCPRDAQELFQQLAQAKVAYDAATLSADENRALHDLVLGAVADPFVKYTAIASDRQTVITRISANIQSVATSMTQFSFFRTNFADVLQDALAATQS